MGRGKGHLDCSPSRIERGMKRMCDNAYCDRPIKLMTPPVSNKDRSKQFCSLNCQKLHDGEIKGKEWEKRRNASN